MFFSSPKKNKKKRLWKTLQGKKLLIKIRISNVFSLSVLSFFPPFYRHFPPLLDNVKHWAVFSYFMWFFLLFRPHAILYILPAGSFFFLFMELVDDVRECGGGQTLYAGDFIGPSPLLVLRRMCCVWWNILGQRCWIAMTTRALGLSPILFSVRESKVGEKSPRLYRYAPRRQAI